MCSTHASANVECWCQCRCSMSVLGVGVGCRYLVPVFNYVLQIRCVTIIYALHMYPLALSINQLINVDVGQLVLGASARCRCQVSMLGDGALLNNALQIRCVTIIYALHMYHALLNLNVDDQEWCQKGSTMSSMSIMNANGSKHGQHIIILGPY